jgi:hypothetical protein
MLSRRDSRRSWKSLWPSSILAGSRASTGGTGVIGSLSTVSASGLTSGAAINDPMQAMTVSRKIQP